MAHLKELRQFHIQKLNDLKKLGIDPYPSKSYRDTNCDDVTTKFDDLKGKEVVVSGRIVSIRKHGSLCFLDLKDQSGKIQLYIKRVNMQPADYSKNQLNYDDFELLDIGDFLDAQGIVGKTESGQISVEVRNIRLLTKSLRSLPLTWDGLKDKETRLRKRYLDTNINKEVFERFERRSRFWEAHREFFIKNGFLEINIPVLEAVTGGADANPFVTHMDALDQDFYLRISHELPLKRLIGGGYERVYDIGPRFRNEGLSDEHLPEHVAMEFYMAYADYNDGMEFVQELFRYVCGKVYKKLKFNIRGFEVDLSKDWKRIDYSQIIKERFGIDIFNTSIDEIKTLLLANKGNIEDGININRGIDALWKLIRATIEGPIFIINEPKFLSPLAKSDPGNPLLTQRFHPVIAGSELGNGFSELNDPIDQLDRFLEQEKLRESGDNEAQMLDIDFVEMLEYGMPPTFGYGHSERTFWFLEDVSAREGVPFPQLKHEIDSEAKDIYPEVFGE